MPQDPVLSPDDARASGPYRLLDVRPAAAHAEATAPGAVRVPIEDWTKAAATGDTGLENTAHWQAEIAALGVGPDAPALVFDDGTMVEAARVWFVLQYFGAPAFVLNGGWPALAGAEPPAAAGPGSAAFAASPGSGPVGLVDRHRLKADLGRVAVLDSRTADEFTGADPKMNPRAGHIPGARLLPHASLLENGRLRPPDELRAMIADAGLAPGDALVTHCQGGGRAALAALAALRAGQGDVRVYYLSFGDWAADESCPITR